MKKLLLLLCMVAALFGAAALEPTGMVAKAALAAQCNDGIDNDGDFWIDYPAEPNCISYTDDTELAALNGARNQCVDGKDNDFDGQKDPYNYGTGFTYECQGPDDWSEENGLQFDPASQATAAACADGRDNDVPMDYKVDYPQDPGCTSPTDTDEADGVVTPPPPPPPVYSGTACDNGLDDDNDLKIDYPADPGCYAKADTDEGNVAQCSDGVDNDADNKIDYNPVAYPSNLGKDDGCDSPWDDTEYLNVGSPPPAQTVGISLDGDLLCSGLQDLNVDPTYCGAVPYNLTYPGVPAWDVECKVQAGGINFYQTGARAEIISRISISCNGPITAITLVGGLFRRSTIDNKPLARDVEVDTIDGISFGLYYGNRYEIVVTHECEGDVFNTRLLQYWTNGYARVTFASGNVLQTGTLIGPQRFVRCF